MRRVTRFKRSTAPSKAWMPNARPQWRCQAPQPRSGAPKAQGLIAALWSQHNPACRRSLQTAAPTQTTFTGAVALMATSAPAVKLHLLDGRDLFTIRDPWWASCISQTPDNAVSFICGCYEPGIICELSKLLLNLY